MTYSPKAERKRIRKVAKKWRRVLGLDEWILTTNFTDGTLLVDGALSPRAAGSAEVQWEYRQACINFNLQATAKMTDEELEECYIHEAMHVLLHEMREEDADLKHEERTASSLAFAFMRARKGL